MRYRILCVGRQARDPLLAAAEDYRARLCRFVDTELVRVREGTLEAEAAQLRKRLAADDYVVALDEHGAQLATVALANKLAALGARGVRSIAFLIGGADGLDAELKRLARERLALSQLTLPHRLVQVLLLEQLYRAHSLLRGEPYHRA